MKKRLKLLAMRSPVVYAAARRAYVRLRYRAGRPHEPDFALFAQYPDRKGLFLDVGANSGLSALSFRIFHRDAPILSIEPNPYHEPDLKRLRRILAPFDYLICAAGAAPGEATLHVPIFRGIALTGEASMELDFLHDGASLEWSLGRRPAASELEIVELHVEVRRLDDLALAPDFIKIDVQGFELPVVRGLLETIGRSRPIVLVENSEHSPEVATLLAPLAYRPFVYVAAEHRVESYTGQRALNIFLLPDG